MRATKVIIIRHAEKPGPGYQGVDQFGAPDKESLIPVGWQRAGALATLFSPTYGPLQNPALAAPNAIYAASPASSAPKDSDESADKGDSGPSKRPFQTVLPLSFKTSIAIADLSFDLPSAQTCTILIAWQHQYILPSKNRTKSIVTELIEQTGGQAPPNVPSGPWPKERFDIVFVFDRPSGTGSFTAFTQVPQMLLGGDSPTPIPVGPRPGP